ncbi:hypothetical protein BKN38_00040 [Helicobacter sp. CLO-3]|nr:hypothetical protein BA723_01440 [Helicobacter sp. CLO-3]OHU85836.1 hypothetical protein BKN38_00040 [Helicobacter sp. CLO-3]
MKIKNAQSPKQKNQKTKQKAESKSSYLVSSCLDKQCLVALSRILGALALMLAYLALFCLALLLPRI